MSAPSDDLPKRPRRFRWQFGLRTLLGLMLLACVAFAYLAHYRREYERAFEREQPAIKAIAEIGGKCEMSADAPKLARWLASDKTSRVVAVDLSYRETASGIGPQGCITFFSLHDRVTDAWLQQLVPLEHVETLDLSGNAISGEGLAVVGSLKRLKTLNLSDCAIEESDLARLEPLKELQSLRLQDVRGGDEGLRRIGALTNLVELEIGGGSGAAVTAEGLQHLQTLSRLEKLYLLGANVLEAEIKALEGLPNLRTLHVGGISPLAIHRIGRLGSLRTVSLRHAGQTADIAAIRQLKKSRPELAVITYPELSDDDTASSPETAEFSSPNPSTFPDVAPPPPLPPPP